MEFQILQDEKTTSSLDANFIKEELILVRNEIKNGTGSRIGNQNVWSYKSNKFKCNHSDENFANISSLNVHNSRIHKCPHYLGDGITSTNQSERFEGLG